MILYIIRHTIAAPAGLSEDEDDSQRPLTDKGSRRMYQIAQGLRVLETQIDLILTSPYLRAAQTASILAKTLGPNKDKVILSRALSPAGYSDQVLQDINEKFGDCGSIALVGHEPSLSGLVSLLVSGDPTLGTRLRKGGVCKLSVDQLRAGRCATLEWLLSPAQLVEIGA